MFTILPQLQSYMYFCCGGEWTKMQVLLPSLHGIYMDPAGIINVTPHLQSPHLKVMDACCLPAKVPGADTSKSHESLMKVYRRSPIQVATQDKWESMARCSTSTDLRLYHSKQSRHLLHEALLKSLPRPRTHEPRHQNSAARAP